MSRQKPALAVLALALLPTLAVPGAPSAGAQDAAPQPATGLASAALDADERAALDRVLEEWDRDDGPGLAAAVWRDGELVYAVGRGLADLERGVPITADSRFRIASTSKQFTAAAILLLVEDGALDLETPVHELIDELPAFEPPVRVRHLVAHQSGLPDYLWLMELKGLDDASIYSFDEALAVLARVTRTVFEPGARFDYSNTNYLLLAEIVRRVSGRTLREFAAERIFTPLAMTSSHFHDRRTELVPNRAMGYTRSDDPLGWELSMTPLELIGDGGVLTSVGDLFRWSQDIRVTEDGRVGVLRPASVAQQLTPFALADGTPTDYAFGLSVRAIEAGTLVEHSGRFVGYVADMLHCPEAGFGAVVLCNHDEPNPPALCARLLRALDLDLASTTVDDVADGPAEGRREPTRAPKSARQLRGIWMATDGGVVRLALVRGSVRLSGPAGRYDLEPVDADALHFASADGGTVLRAVDTHLELTDPSGAVTRLERELPPASDATYLDAQFAGAWHVRELDEIWTLRRREQRTWAYDVLRTRGTPGRVAVEGARSASGPFGTLMWRADGERGWRLWSESFGLLHLERPGAAPDAAPSDRAQRVPGDDGR
ncbi:serine hydrolase domain-containing protein [Rohdeia mirabilis]|uniref:serine hydrolase domain-containing protein n=1 Tax=Rohdeia mirabilis TaxID=2528008 RepID=UPI003AF4031C